MLIFSQKKVPNCSPNERTTIDERTASTFNWSLDD